MHRLPECRVLRVRSDVSGCFLTNTTVRRQLSFYLLNLAKRCPRICPTSPRQEANVVSPAQGRRRRQLGAHFLELEQLRHSPVAGMVAGRQFLGTQMHKTATARFRSSTTSPRTHLPRTLKRQPLLPTRSLHCLVVVASSFESGVVLVRNARRPARIASTTPHHTRTLAKLKHRQ